MVHMYAGARTEVTLHPMFFVPALPRAWSLTFAAPRNRQRVWAVRSGHRGSTGLRESFSFYSNTETDSAIDVEDYQDLMPTSVIPVTVSGDTGDTATEQTNMSGINHGPRGRL